MAPLEPSKIGGRGGGPGPDSGGVWNVGCKWRCGCGCGGGGGCTRLAGEAQDKTLLAVKMLEEMGFAGCGREALCEILLKAEARSFSHRSQQVTAGP